MKSLKLQIRVSPEEKELWQSYAKGRGLSLTQFLSEAANSVMTGEKKGEVKGEVVMTSLKEDWDKAEKSRQGKNDVRLYNNLKASVSKKSAAEEAIEKAKKIESKWKGPMFKDSKLNKF